MFHFQYQQIAGILDDWAPLLISYHFAVMKGFVIWLRIPPREKNCIIVSMSVNVCLNVKGDHKTSLCLYYVSILYITARVTITVSIKSVSSSLASAL